jgi:hypothetical protein
MDEAIQSGGCQQVQYGRSAAKELNSSAGGGNGLILVGADAEEGT